MQLRRNWTRSRIFVLITGDFVHEGGPADYAAAKQFVENMERRYGHADSVALGNHDRHDAFYRGYCEMPAHSGPYYYRIKMPGLRLLVLDSAVDDQVPGRLDSEQLQWLEDQLQKTCATPTVVALHHPALRDDRVCHQPEQFAETGAVPEDPGARSGQSCAGRAQTLSHGGNAAGRHLGLHRCGNGFCH